MTHSRYTNGGVCCVNCSFVVRCDVGEPAGDDCSCVGDWEALLSAGEDAARGDIWGLMEFTITSIARPLHEHSHS